MPKRKICIATPLQGQVSSAYQKLILDVMLTKTPDVEFIYSTVEGGAVSTARTGLVHFALDQNCDEMIFWDKDLLPELHQLGRLLAHDVDIVCAQYAKRGLPTKFHGQELPGETAHEGTCLQKMKFAPIGLSKIKMDVFRKIKEVFPERAHAYQELSFTHTDRHEFFPTGLVGPNTAEGKLERLNALFYSEGSAEEFGQKAGEILNDSDYSQTNYYGEDYYFCLLARKAGFDINIDTALIIPHLGETTFPITNGELVAMSKEPWRKRIKGQ